MSAGQANADQGRPAVVYLARAAEGTAAFARFAASYRRLPAGKPHDLTIVYKGFDDDTAGRAAAAAVFADLPARAIDIDDTHVDIGAYLEAARRLPNRRVAFLNTHSEIVAPDWLARLAAALDRPGVGLAGASASLESLSASMELTSKAIWYADVLKAPYDPVIARHFHFALIAQVPKWLEGAAAAARPSIWFEHGQWRWRALEPQWESYWRAVTAETGPLHFLSAMAPFPNPHLRSNGFMVDRTLLLALFGDLPPGKVAAYGFESGTASLSRRIRDRGLALRLATRDGDWAQDAWPASNSFRVGDQSDLLIADNQTRAFDAMSPWERDTHVLMTWGEAALPPGAGCAMGMAFRNPALAGPAASRQAHLCDNADYGAPHRRLDDASVLAGRQAGHDGWLTT